MMQFLGLFSLNCYYRFFYLLFTYVMVIDFDGNAQCNYTISTNLRLACPLALMYRLVVPSAE